MGRDVAMRALAKKMAEKVYDMECVCEGLMYNFFTPEVTEHIRRNLKNQPDFDLDGSCITHNDVHNLSIDEFYARIRNANAPIVSAESKEDAVKYVTDFLIMNRDIMAGMNFFVESNFAEIIVEGMKEMLARESSKSPESLVNGYTMGGMKCPAWLEPLQNTRPHSSVMIIQIMCLYRLYVANEMCDDDDEYDEMCELSDALQWVLDEHVPALPTYT